MQTESSGFGQVKQSTATRLGKEKRLHACNERSVGNNGILPARFVKAEYNLRDQAQRLEKMQDRKGEVVRNDIGLESTGNRMD